MCARHGTRGPVTCSFTLFLQTFIIEMTIGEFSIAIGKLTKALNIPSQLYATNFDPTYRGLIRPTVDLVKCASEQDIILLQHSTYERYMDLILESPASKVLYYHNITPPQTIQIYDAEKAIKHSQAIKQLCDATRCDGLMANSQYSAKQLAVALTEAKKSTRSSGIVASAPRNENFIGPVAKPGTAPSKTQRALEVKPQITPCPPVLGLSRWDTLPESSIELPSGSPILLYVGRLAPHKCIEDLFELLLEYKSFADSDPLLVVVGSASYPSYGRYLEHLLATRYEPVKDRILCMGSIEAEQLKWLYKRADAYVTMSEHEGFCIPLLEAMCFHKPVFAYAQSAIRETLGESGCVFHDKNFQAIARRIDLTLKSLHGKQQMIAAQDERIAYWMHESDGRRLWRAFEGILFGCDTDNQNNCDTFKTQ
jgi:glycosyltransferase involved in cell wall biosynthesis